MQTTPVTNIARGFGGRPKLAWNERRRAKWRRISLRSQVEPELEIFDEPAVGEVNAADHLPAETPYAGYSIRKRRNAQPPLWVPGHPRA